MEIESTKKSSWMSRVIDGISGVFLPLVNLLSAAGILKGLLTILVATALLSESSGTYLVLNAMADSLFYFLPMLLAFTAAKKFGTDPFTAVAIAGVLVYPKLAVVMEAGTAVDFLGLSLRGVTYHSSVIPIIMAVGLLVYAERFLNQILPAIVKGFLTPLLCVVFVGFVTLAVFGPIGAVIGDALAAGYDFVYSLSPVIAGALLGAAVQPMVIFGFHWSLVLISMSNISANGYDTILTFMAAPIFAQAGAAFAVMLKSKDASFRSTCASAILSALFGVTEPVMFGINLPRKKPMAAVCIGGGIGGAIAGFSGARAVTFAFPGVATMPIFFGPGFGILLFSCLVGFLAAFALTMVFRFEVE